MFLNVTWMFIIFFYDFIYYTKRLNTAIVTKCSWRSIKIFSHPIISHLQSTINYCIAGRRLVGIIIIFYFNTLNVFDVLWNRGRAGRNRSWKIKFPLIKSTLFNRYASRPQCHENNYIRNYNCPGLIGNKKGQGDDTYAGTSDDVLNLVENDLSAIET